MQEPGDFTHSLGMNGRGDPGFSTDYDRADPGGYALAPLLPAVKCSLLQGAATAGDQYGSPNSGMVISHRLAGAGAEVL